MLRFKNIRHKQSLLVWGLLACFVVVGVAMAVGVSQHATATHHDHNTHAQTWCGWMCAAGQALQGPAISLDHTWTPISQVDLHFPHPPRLTLTLSPGTRGPPPPSV